MAEQFPTSEYKVEQYETLGQILADTAIGLGMDLDLDEQKQWSYLMGRFASGDDLFEESPDVFSSPASVLEHLGLDARDNFLTSYAAGLMFASRAADEAVNIDTHFNYRAMEAKYCVDIICHSTIRFKVGNTHIWSQIYDAAIFGQLVDAIRDAKDDANRLPQFTANELRMGAARQLVAKGFDVKPKTWIELGLASHRYGLDTYLVKRLGGVASLGRSKQKGAYEEV